MLDDAPEYEEKRFQVLTKTDINNIQEKMVTELSGQLGLSKGETALVLILFEYAIAGSGSLWRSRETKPFDRSVLVLPFPVFSFPGYFRGRSCH